MHGIGVCVCVCICACVRVYVCMCVILWFVTSRHHACTVMYLLGVLSELFLLLAVGNTDTVILCVLLRQL